MQVFFIKQNKKYNFFRKVELYDDKILINSNVKKMNLNKKIKIVKKICKILAQNSVNTIILEKNLKKDEELRNLIYSKNIEIIDGKNLYKVLIIDFIKRVCEKNKMNLAELKISIIANENYIWLKEAIYELGKLAKELNIITNNPKSFEKINQSLLEKEGIIIFCTNNRKKALCKSNIILNLDFSQEEINKYIIYDNSIIISIDEKIKIFKKRFNGEIIDNYNIKLKQNSKTKFEEFNEFELKDVVECYITTHLDVIENIEIIV